ncbi:MAG: hypothetical protein ACRDF4_10685, partial [Rhabdochlamydiaceae bacterium]
SWYVYGENLLTGKQTISDFLIPYRYSFFLFVFPSTALFNFLTKFIPSYTLQMSSIDPILRPGAQWNILVVPGLLFDFLVKLVLIMSDTLIAYLLYKLVAKYTNKNELAVSVAATWFLNPLTIWISSVWGTFDTLPALFTLSSLYLVLNEKSEFSGLSLAAAIASKYYAIVLVIPLVILAWKHEGKNGLLKVLTSAGLSSLILFSPSMESVLTGFVNVATSTSTTGLHYSGLSFWTALTLFSSNFNQTIISSLMIAVSLTIFYFWMWKRREIEHDLFHSTLIFCLPILLLLLFYGFIGENFFMWVLPFLTILSLRSFWIRSVYWILSLIVLISSMTDSLLPYYMLPISPWIGTWLVHIVNIVYSYKVAPNGVINQGLPLGKIALSILGILTSALITFMVIHVFRDFDRTNENQNRWSRYPDPAQ